MITSFVTYFKYKITDKNNLCFGYTYIHFGGNVKRNCVVFHQLSRWAHGLTNSHINEKFSPSHFH